MINELAQKEYKTKRDRVGKVIHRELFKKFKFVYTNKWYVHNSESVQENETHKIHWDFERQRDPLISARQPNLVIVEKKKTERKRKE